MLQFINVWPISTVFTGTKNRTRNILNSGESTNCQYVKKAKLSLTLFFREYMYLGLDYPFAYLNNSALNKQRVNNQSVNRETIIYYLAKGEK